VELVEVVGLAGEVGGQFQQGVEVKVAGVLVGDVDGAAVDAKL
jgi:hypothetical protein